MTAAGARTKTTTPTTTPTVPNDSFLRASFDGTTARNSQSSHSNHSHWRPITARSSASADRTARRRSPSPLLNPLARISRHRQHDDVGRHEPAARHSSSSSGSGMRAGSGNARSRRTSYTSNGRRSSHSGTAPPPLTHEEFEALPVAIQRKYFSTLERLRFAQGSAFVVDGISQHYDAISAQNLHRRRARQDRLASDNITTRLRKRSFRERPVPFEASVADTLFFANLPDKIKKRDFTREEQVLLAGQLRASVILDAADEAIYRIGRRSSATHRLYTAPDITVDSPTTASFRLSMETAHSDSRDSRLASRRDVLGLDLGTAAAAKRMSGVPESFYDSFRWLEEEDDLDLRLFLDDYHSNLREQLPSPTKERRPSFRRRLSISKKPFGRPSLQSPTYPGSNSSRPATKDDVSMRAPPATATASISASSPRSAVGSGGGSGTIPFPSLPPHSPASTLVTAMPHVRRKSRTLSLITPRHHVAHDSISTIDPGAAHYQDPEARLKLRVYLASPQKFDEAIEFGFPSTEVLSAVSSPPLGSSTLVSSGSALPSPTTASKRRPGQQPAAGSDTLRTFLADNDDDDDYKLDSDQASVPDSDSPKTPHLVPEAAAATTATATSAQGSGKPSVFRPYRISTEPLPGQQRPSDTYAQVPATSREMTLRMTLTRLDLRAGEDQIYGWQQQQHHGHQPQPSFSGRKSSSTSQPRSPRDDGLVVGSGTAAANMENIFAGIDHWEADQEKGVMKRFWNRVRRS